MQVVDITRVVEETYGIDNPASFKSTRDTEALLARHACMVLCMEFIRPKVSGVQIWAIFGVAAQYANEVFQEFDRTDSRYVEAREMLAEVNSERHDG